MTHLKSMLIGATLAFSASAAQAVVVTADSYGENATGSWAYYASDTVVQGNLVTSAVAGILDTYTIWVQEGSTAATAGFDLDLTLLGGHSGVFPSLTDELATTSFSGADIYSGTSILGGTGLQFYALTWDLSAFNITTAVDENFVVRFSNTSSGLSYGISGNSSRQPNALPNPTSVNRLSGSPTSVGSGTVSNSFGYSLTVENGIADPIDPVATVPLPAGLPLLLAGLGAFGLIRRRG